MTNEEPENTVLCPLSTSPMKRDWPIWIGFVFCLAIVLAAMGFISLTALRLDRAEADARRAESQARRQAAWEEKVRLALWRMDSVLAPFVAQQSAYPYFAYSAFLPVNRAYSAMFNPRGGGEMLIPSPLLSDPSPNILVHFQFEPDGRLTSPQVPTASNKKLAVPKHVTEPTVRRAETQLARVESLVDGARLLAMLPESGPEPIEMVASPLAQTPEQRLAQRQQRMVELQNRGRGAVEFNQRNTAFGQQATNVMALNRDLSRQNPLLPSTDVSGVLMTPLWMDGSLLLARRITAGGREYVQGCLLDWPAIKTSLLETIEDLLPGADLKPAKLVTAEGQPRMLAAVPVRLIPGEPIIPASAGVDGSLSPIVLSLAVAWVCVLLAGVAVAVLLFGAMRLAERRTAFVSAVTHELRTPLTTFQMYAEMLAEGMVGDEQQQQHYLNTLRGEALRLTHLVENVLAYARLERGRADGRLVSIPVDELIRPAKDRLMQHAERAGMELIVQEDGPAGEPTVRAIASAVEQILFNLVDNACKYASASADKQIHIEFARGNRAVEVSVRDHGSGVSPAVRRRLFRSFAKSAHEAAHSAPGVGLGLALSRRLARDMGGDLRLDEKVTDGARFVLTLQSTS